MNKNRSDRVKEIHNLILQFNNQNRHTKINTFSKIVLLLKDKNSLFLLEKDLFRVVLKQKMSEFYFQGCVLEAAKWYREIFNTDIGEPNRLIKPSSKFSFQ